MEIKELEKISDFKLGAENTAFAEYFKGKSCLSILNNNEVNLDR